MKSGSTTTGFEAEFVESGQVRTMGSAWPERKLAQATFICCRIARRLFARNRSFGLNEARGFPVIGSELE